MSVYKDKLSSVPPVRPIAGQIFLFDLGADTSLWEKQRRQLRYIVSRTRTYVPCQLNVLIISLRL